MDSSLNGFSQLSIQDFLAELASKSPAPGGGAAAPMCAAIASALGGMVVAYSVGKKSLSEHQAALEVVGERLNTASMRFQALAEEDAVAYARLNELQRLPDGDSRLDQIPEAKRTATEIPVQVVEVCVETLRECVSLAPISNKYLRSDLAITAVLLESCARASRWMVLANAGDDPAPLRRADAAIAEAAALLKQVEEACAPA